jgi:uncharacterized RDD family membrane protein YckC
VKVGDFGLAKSLLSDSHLTRTGAFLGTPLFVSPEQARADPVDHQTDVYSVAATLYYLLTGRAPHQTRDAAATLARIGSDSVTSLRHLRPELPASLDQAVLRGLERDRKRRWRDLAELRTALLPFIANHDRPAPLSLRLTAYALDWGLFLPAMLATVFLLPAPEFLQAVPLLPLFWKLWTVPWLLYFFFLEAFWGCSLGKRLLGLRVRAADASWSVIPRCIVVRTVVFVGCVNVPYVVVGRALRLAGAPDWLLFPAVFVVHILSVLFVFLPQWRRARGQGLHDLLSNTRVIALPEARRAWTPALPTDAHALQQPAGLPEQIGPFVVCGAFRWVGDGGLVAAHDPALGRPVWIHLRPLDAPPLDEARRAVSRSTRLRWLTGGCQHDWQWDAFQAPPGCSLLSLIEGEGPLTWPEAQPLLEQLTTEVVAACREGTLPVPLALGQVWVQPSGRVQLLDTPPGLEGTGGPHLTCTTDEAPALRLLGQTAALVLEGKPRPASVVPQPLRAPLPGAVARLLNRLPGLDAAPLDGLAPFQAELTALRDHPAEVRAAPRAGALASLAVLLLPGLAALFLLPSLDHAWQLRRLQAEIDWLTGAGDLLQDSDRRATLVAKLPADAPGRDLLHSAYADGLPPPWLTAQLAHASNAFADYHQPLTWPDEVAFKALRWLGPPVGADDIKGPQLLEAALGRRPEMVCPPTVPFRHLLYILVPPLLWVVWAFLARGGLVWPVLGLTLVRPDGRRATRGQCAVRALLVWLVPVLLLLASLGVTATAPRWGELALCLQMLAAAVLASYVLLALRFPPRGLHDRLAGTYLVPR